MADNLRLLTTFQAVVKKLGGVAEVARLVDQRSSAVSNFKRMVGGGIHLLGQRILGGLEGP